MDATDYIYRLALALGIGILVGVQREAVHDEPEGKLFAGARTFALFSLLGYVLALASTEAGSASPFLGGLIVLGGLLALAYRADVKEGKPGMTTEMSAVVIYATGGICYWGLLPLAAALGVTVTAMLALKHEFRSFSHAITRQDIYATVTFAVISVIVLPLLPDEAFGPVPLNVFNPYRIWLMVVFISGISFFGYVLIRIVGARRGIGLTGLLGGIASSTAVTLSFAQRSREDERLARPFSLAILVAWAVMFVRVVVVVFALAPILGRALIAPMLAAAGVGLLYSAVLYLAQRSDDKDTIRFTNPFELGPAIRFGALYAIVLLVSRAAQFYLGDVGVYASSFVSGLVDVNAIALSMVDLTQRDSGLALAVASRAIVIATLSNTLFKGIFVLVTGSKALRQALWPGFALMLVTGAAVAFLL